MQLIKDGAFIADPWTHVGDEDALPGAPDAGVIVSLERWQRESNELTASGRPLGVQLKSGQDPSEIARDLDKLSLVGLEFPAYRNGRAYSYASLLRQRYGFKGEVRAVGNVLRDQFLNMIRCGFDALEVADNITPAIYAEMTGEFTHAYQTAADGRPAVMSLRQRLAAKNAAD
ncbi:MAG: DUF934 domain-containing protein [Parvibaculaceae bacterium]|nr:DUF934 domain-containing protein [Parvibaculaceae bacterium]